MQSVKMNPPTLIVMILPVLLLTTLLVERSHAQRAPSYLERLDIASHIFLQATSDSGSTDSDGSEKLQLVQNLMQLSPSQVQTAVLQSVQRLSFESSEERTGNTLQQRLEGEAQIGQNASQLCFDHTAAFIIDLLEGSSWATQMVDAMGKPIPGFTQGNIAWIGGYQQCLDVRANTTDVLHPFFSGQYCTARIPLSSGTFGVPVQLTIGLCVPDTCSGLDLTLLINDVLSNLNTNQSVQIFVDCAEHDTSLDAKAIVAIVICSLLLFIIVVGTVLDLLFIQMPKWRMEEKEYSPANGYSSLEEREQEPLLGKPRTVVPEIAGTGIKIFLAFSVYTNGSKLLSTKQAPGSLTCIHGIRFLSMTWVVLGHTYIWPLTSGAAANLGPYMQGVVKRWSFQAISNATVSVDTFFVLSGLLVAYLSLKEMKKKSGKINWFLFYFHRFWRLTPAYMLVIMVYVCLSPYWGEGPLWPAALPDRDSCETSWWANLLYINNLVKMDKMCLAQSWYLSNDMQFYILSPLIFVPFYFSPLLGTISSVIFLLVTSIVPGVLTVRDHFPPNFFPPGMVEGNNTDPTMMTFMQDFYMKPYNRMGPYVVGMLGGYFLYRTDCRLRINKIVNLLLWALATGCALGVLYGLYDASNGHPVTVSVSAFYNAVNRQVWGACVVWVIIACVTGNGGFVNTLLSWSALVPLSRLTYCIYLLHIMMLELYLLNQNSTFYMNDINVVMFFLGILVVSYMAAFVTSLAFEAPMMGLEKVLFQRHKKEEKELK